MNNLANPIRRIYVDTSVVGGLFDTEFKWQTKPFWDAVQQGSITVIVSDMLDKELENAPAHIRDFIPSLPNTSLERIVSGAATELLADKYLIEKVVGKTSRDDCMHIALATIARADVLVSWNFRHIVNVNRIRGYNGVNLLLGYQPLDIRTPREVVYDI